MVKRWRVKVPAGGWQLPCPHCGERVFVRPVGIPEETSDGPPRLTEADVVRIIEDRTPPPAAPDPDPLPQPAIPDGWEVVVEREAVRGEGGELAGTTERRRLVRTNGQGGGPGWVEVVERQAVRGPDGQLTGTTERRRCVREGNGDDPNGRDGVLSPLRPPDHNSGERRDVNAVADAAAGDTAADDGGRAAGG